MPQDLPGFYYDAEKNRYFPNKPRIPGSSSFSNASPSQNNPLSSFLQATKLCPKTRVPASKLLHLRELNGNAFSYDRGRHSFVEEFHKLHASKPVVWRYGATDENLLRDIRYSALEQTQIDVQTLEGQMETEVLLVGSMDGSLSLLKVGSERHFDYGITHIPDRVWPSTKGDAESDETPPYVSRPAAAPLHMPSRISSIRLCEKQSFSTNNYDSKFQCSLITTLGSETYGGFVYILNLLEPVDFTSRLDRRLHAVATFNHTIWTADYSFNTAQAAIGTDIGVALVNVERGATKWVCRSKSDVLAVQFDQTGNIVLCGLRNGAIVTVDVRENQERMFSRLTKLKIPYSSSGRSSQKRWFEIKGLISPSHTIHMPSSISSLVSLQSYDQYFLASSMDGSMKLYDHRLTKRGAVQSYGGHVNSHTRIQLGVDQSERFVMSGGEDCYLRLWSIKSGKMLFGEKFSDSVLTNICWRRAQSTLGKEGEIRQNHNCRAWLASEEGLFHMHWS
ncbi:hypothetical protein ES319_D11G053300v1 [Gossypium barbadense]|uniref:Uncharacterized protein n=1 Tax=Gossypium barbadense TaxID=3634 RepID=A0A5J5P7D9_GOSBA|nr:hypothetical protein ES319_D11G053300v1 [Gossypium barbadense]